LPTVLSNLRRAKTLVREYMPDVLILVDYPSFNLRLAEYAHKIGVRVDWMIAPKVWAWKEWRIPKLKKYVSNMYSILPFETNYFRKHGMEVRYVGNPTVKEIEQSLGHIPPRKHFLERQGISDQRPIIAILPGSRKGEIRNNLPLMIEAAKRFPDYQYIIAAAPSVPEKFYRSIAQDAGLSLAFGATHTLLKYSAAAIVTSGTATLETAVIGTPQVVCYRANGSRITYRLMKKLLKVKYVSLPNLIVGNSIVTELLLHNCTADRIARELGPLLQPSPQRDWQLSGYRNMKKRLGTTDASKIAAEYICRKH
ncbi:MAG: lipid-A-disaccharide synthase, partial [Muribaculaceae bacterium]|nr:lipid-A-disaccharide synthase [Muribaculaceae bacterium]